VRRKKWGEGRSFTIVNPQLPGIKLRLSLIEVFEEIENLFH
jgi:hypothetical protein